MSKNDPQMSELNGYIPKHLKLKFKSLCAAQDRSMSEVLAELIVQWIEVQENQLSHSRHDD